MDSTNNYKLRKPSEKDFFTIDDFNHNMELLDSEIKQVSDETGKLLNSGTLATLNKEGKLEVSQRANVPAVQISDYHTFNPEKLSLQPGESINIYADSKANSPWPSASAGILTCCLTAENYDLIIIRTGVNADDSKIASRSYNTSDGWDSWKFLLTTTNIANDLTTASNGKVLDARQGKILDDTKAPIKSPVFTGEAQVPDPADNSNGTIVPNTRWVTKKIKGFETHEEYAAVLSEEDLTYPLWMKVADASWKSDNVDSNITFLVTKLMNTTTSKAATGILSIGLRETSSDTSASIKWLMKSNDIAPADFAITYNESAGKEITIAIYAKVSERWQGYKFTVLSSSLRNTKNTHIFNLYQVYADKENAFAAIPSLGTIQYSNFDLDTQLNSINDKITELSEQGTSASTPPLLISDFYKFDPISLKLEDGQSQNIYSDYKAHGAPWDDQTIGTLTKISSDKYYLHLYAARDHQTNNQAFRYFEKEWLDWQIIGSINRELTYNKNFIWELNDIQPTNYDQFIKFNLPYFKTEEDMGDIPEEGEFYGEFYVSKYASYKKIILVNKINNNIWLKTYPSPSLNKALPPWGEWVNLTASNTINNLTTTVPGFALDARQGKILDDKISALSSGGSSLAPAKPIEINDYDNPDFESLGLAVGQTLSICSQPGAYGAPSYENAAGTITKISDDLYKIEISTSDYDISRTAKRYYGAKIQSSWEITGTFHNQLTNEDLDSLNYLIFTGEYSQLISFKASIKYGSFAPGLNEFGEFYGQLYVGRHGDFKKMTMHSIHSGNTWTRISVSGFSWEPWAMVLTSSHSEAQKLALKSKMSTDITNQYSAYYSNDMFDLQQGEIFERAYLDNYGAVIKVNKRCCLNLSLNLDYIYIESGYKQIRFLNIDSMNNVTYLGSYKTEVANESKEFSINAFTYAEIQENSYLAIEIQGSSQDMISAENSQLVITG